jgi:molybdate transport system substrate-binding protein
LPIFQIARSSNKFLKLVSQLGYRNPARLTVFGWVLLPLLLAISGINSHLSAQAKVLHVAAAADLQPVLPTLAAQYEHQTGVKIIASFGSSATLAQQITNGDPQDVFLSADTAQPQKLVTANLAMGLVTYARGVLVLWARTDSPAQPIAIASLVSDKVSRIAVANDLHAPYGLAATSALKALSLYDRVKSKLVVGENIGQTAQFALTGNAQAALISLTIASSKPYREAGSFIPIPKVYPEIRQSGVVLTASKNQVAAKAFLQWLTSAPIQKSLTTFGLDPAN